MSSQAAQTPRAHACAGPAARGDLLAGADWDACRQGPDLAAQHGCVLQHHQCAPWHIPSWLALPARMKPAMAPGIPTGVTSSMTLAYANGGPAACIWSWTLASVATILIGPAQRAGRARCRSALTLSRRHATALQPSAWPKSPAGSPRLGVRPRRPIACAAHSWPQRLATRPVRRPILLASTAAAAAAAGLLVPAPRCAVAAHTAVWCRASFTAGRHGPAFSWVTGWAHCQHASACLHPGRAPSGLPACWSTRRWTNLLGQWAVTAGINASLIFALNTTCLPTPLCWRPGRMAPAPRPGCAQICVGRRL